MTEPSFVKQINIAHVVFSFDYGGLERRILRLVESLGPKGFRFTIISLRESDGRFLDPMLPVEHINLHAQPGIDLDAIRRLARILKERHTHIVHSHNWVSMLEGVVAGRLANVPVVLHGEHGAKRFQSDQLVLRRTIVQMMLARLTTKIIPVNDAINEKIQAVWKLKPERLTTIRNGVDTEKFSPSPRVTDEYIEIGSISRLEQVKNFPCLIRALQLLNQGKSQPRYRLTIVGAGSEEENLKSLTKSLNANDYVQFPGATDHAERWYGKFDIYVNCSFSEGMSNTVLEAMSCGLPVVATDVAGHRDWLTEGENALFFLSDDERNLASKLSELGDDSQRRRDISLTNRKYVENHLSQHRFIRRYEDLYHQLLKGKLP